VGEEPRCYLAGDAPVVVLRHRGSIVALDAHCPHRGAPMDEGTVDGDVFTCPWHGSQFDLPTGSLHRGPAVTALPAHECRVVDGTVEVRSRR
jgi:nitrite reductase/ring-hydroxylating ferredoxin subunit